MKSIRNLSCKTRKAVIAFVVVLVVIVAIIMISVAAVDNSFEVWRCIKTRRLAIGDDGGGLGLSGVNDNTNES